MADHGQLAWCYNCGVENAGGARLCRGCGDPLAISDREHRFGAIFLLNELETLRRDGLIAPATYSLLRERYLSQVRQEPPAAATTIPVPLPVTAVPVADTDVPAAPSSVAPRDGPGWLAEQQANLLLYLGAFLIIVATLIFVGRPDQGITDSIRMTLLVLYTLAFLGAGLVCMEFPRVRQAGTVFLGIGALLVPINFVAAYALFYADDNADPTALWLAGSLASAAFYIAVALNGMGRWYPIPAIFALVSAMGAFLGLVGAAPEAYPGSFIVLSFVMSIPAVLSLGRSSDILGPYGWAGGHLIVPVGLLVALMMSGATDDGSSEELFTLNTRWYLPPTAALGAIFYWVHALAARRRDVQLGAMFATKDLVAPLSLAALATTAGAAVTLVYAAEFGEEWYGPAVAAVGWIYAIASATFARTWYGRRYLEWLSVGTIAASCLLFEGIYEDHLRIGAAVHFSAAVFFIAALIRNSDDIVLGGADEGEPLRVPLSVPFVYAAALAAGVGYYQLIASLPAADGATAEDLAWPFFAFSIAFVILGAASRFWRPELRFHLYAIAAATSGLVLLAAADVEGQITLLLALYTAVALMAAVWEEQPIGLAACAVYGFALILGGWRYFEVDDAALPLIIAGVAVGLYATHILLPALDDSEDDQARLLDVDWPFAILAVAGSYALLAPVTGWIRLADLADPQGLVNGESFEETGLYQASTAALLILGLLIAMHGALIRNGAVLVASSGVLMVALLLEIGHFRPDNIQAYAVPLGTYILALGLFGSRVRELPADLDTLLDPLQLLGASILIGPTLVQAWEDPAPYALVVLLEACILLTIALAQRQSWLLSAAVGAIVLVALRYLFDAARALPNEAILAIAGILALSAGTAILFGRERWTEWQRSFEEWWRREPLGGDSAG